jgi:hypothetical protein
MKAVLKSMIQLPSRRLMKSEMTPTSTDWEPLNGNWNSPPVRWVG